MMAKTTVSKSTLAVIPVPCLYTVPMVPDENISG